MEESSTFGIHPWHNDAGRRGNGLACDQLEAMGMILGGRKAWALVTISDGGQIRWAKFDEIKAAASAAFDIADERNAVTVRPGKYLIVSPGGLPNDVDLYISQRALELTKNAVKDGGQVLFVSACPEGVGSERTLENFYNRLCRPLGEILGERGGQYKLFSHKPYKFAQLISRLNEVWIYSEISEADCKRIHLSPTGKPQDVVDGWLARDRDAQIIVVDGANKIALYPEQDGPSGVC
jgi:nickel-dependent lactate racemase